MNGVRATDESKRGREGERSVLDFPFYSVLKREFVPTVRVRADRKAGASTVRLDGHGKKPHAKDRSARTLESGNRDTICDMGGEPFFPT
jgi:hypothetical protein